METLIKKHLDAIKLAQSTDYCFNGEDEELVDTFNEDQAAKDAAKISIEFAMEQLNRAKDLDVQTVYLELKNKLK